MARYVLLSVPVGRPMDLRLGPFTNLGVDVPLYTGSDPSTSCSSSLGYVVSGREGAALAGAAVASAGG